MKIEFKDGELELQHTQRGRCHYLRLITPHRKSGVQIFAQRGLKANAPSRLWLHIFRALYEDVLDIHRRASGGG